jgi:hypothetical protein
VHAVRCGCGYCFDPNKLDGVTQELEAISQEETLYRDYLAARVDQSESAWQAARVAAVREPDNRVKAAEALLAEQNAMAARAEFDAQVERARAVKNRIKVVRTNRRSRRVSVAAPTPRPAPVAVREVLAPKPAPAPIAAPPVPVPAPVQAAPMTPAPAVLKPAAASAQKAAAPTPAPKAIAQAPAPRPVVAAKPAPAHRPAPGRATAAPPPAPTPVATVVRVATPPTPAIVDKPTPSFRASQASRAQQIVAAPANANSQECGNCSAKVPLNVRRCRCGFELPLAASQIPSLSMSPEDRAAFLAALAPLGGESGS